MPKRVNPLDLDLLGDEEEISFGAYARVQLRRRVMVGVFGVLLILGAILVYRVLRPSDGFQHVRSSEIRVQCTTCGHTETLEAPVAQIFPMECSQCGEVTCQPMWHCLSCDEYFIPEQTADIVRCPACGSDQVGSAAMPESNE